MDTDSMALAASFAFPHEAKLAQALLESVGIPAFIRNENVTRLNLAYSIVDGGLLLYVPSSAAEQAREILASQVAPKDLEAQAETAGPREE
jgi:hypothetical protein